MTLSDCHVLGSALPWRWAAGAGVIPTILAVVAAALMPETAPWLLGRSRAGEAEVALVRLRGGGGPEVRAELEELVRAQEERSRVPQGGGGLRHLYRALRKPQFWKPLLIMNVFFAFQQCAGE